MTTPDLVTASDQVIEPNQDGQPRIPVAVLGATGSVGQRFVTLLADHPWFEIVALTASQSSAGKPYSEAVHWMQEQPLPEVIASMEVKATAPPLPCRLVFSALDARAADRAEVEFADAGYFVVSNAGSHRMDPDVPLVVPEVNPDHLELIRHQPYDGAIITNPNCSTIGLVLALKPLVDAFGVSQVQVVTMQAVSGAGLPGVSSMAMIDNLVPFITNEEGKIESETRKILGRANAGSVEPAEIVVSAQANRVPVIDGHTECVALRLERKVGVAEVEEAFRSFSSVPQVLGLPTAPEPPIRVRSEPDRPQPRLDRSRGGGMAVTVGRVRPCSILDFKFVALSHNTLRGAAGGSVLLAELAVAQGLVPGVRSPLGVTS